MRIPTVARLERQKVDVVKAHSEVLHHLGRVTVAKFGAPPKASSVERIERQLQNKVRTLLVLVTKRDGEFFGLESELDAIHLGRVTQDLKAFAPQYYVELAYSGSLWFLLRTPFKTSRLDAFRLSSNRRPVLKVMSECRTALLLVERSGV
jgi:hypothetical protein